MNHEKSYCSFFFIIVIDIVVIVYITAIRSSICYMMQFVYQYCYCSFFSYLAQHAISVLLFIFHAISLLLFIFFIIVAIRLSILLLSIFVTYLAHDAIRFSICLILVNHWMKIQNAISNATKMPGHDAIRLSILLLFIFFIKHIYEMKLHYKNKKIKYEI